MSFWPTDTAGKVGDICSFVGLWLTVVITIITLQIRKQFQRKRDLPEQLVDLTAHSDVLLTLLADFDASIDAIASEIGRLEGTMVAIKRNLRNKDETKAANDVLDMIGQYRNSRTKDNFGEICSRLNTLVVVTKYSVKGLPWE